MSNYEHNHTEMFLCYWKTLKKHTESEGSWARFFPFDVFWFPLQTAEPIGYHPTTITLLLPKTSTVK